MTSAARPTFAPAMGGQNRGETSLSAMTKQYSSRDLVSHTKLKYRHIGQGTVEEVRSQDLKRKLEEREEASKEKSDRKDRDRERQPKSASTFHSAQNKSRTNNDQNVDADDPVEDESDNSSEEEDDDTAGLMAELQKIRTERAAEATKKEFEQRQEEERIRYQNIQSGNPLMNFTNKAPKTNLRVKRRWDDDVVFKNCSRTETDKKIPEFINDTLRSDFHKKFMDRYIK